jgi:RNA polymerase sigma factor (sigma-70 family)
VNSKKRPKKNIRVQPNHPGRVRISYRQLKLYTIYRQTIAKCLKGDRSSQNALYHALAEKMYTVCLRFCRSKHEAEEILQEGFIKVFAALHQYRDIGSFEGWVRKIMVNTALQRYRSQSALHAVVSLELAPDHLQEKELVISGLSAKELLALVQELPAAYRMVFNLYVFEGYQHKEIATMLDISEGTSKSNLHDARRWLKEKISRETNAEKIKSLYL